MGDNANPEISVVIPVYNEAGNVKPLYEELVSVLRGIGKSFEVIFIDDGSTDATCAELRGLDSVVIVEQGRNCGQGAAFSMGFKKARGAIIVTLDGDGQNDPRDIPAMIKMLNDAHYDVIAGWRKDRHDARSIRMISKIGRYMRLILFGDPIHDSGCSLRVYRREAVQGLELEKGMHRYMLLMIKARGYTVGEMAVRHHPRVHGESKYGVSKSFRGTIDLLRLRFSREFLNEELLQVTAMSLLTVAALLALYYARFVI